LTILESIINSPEKLSTREHRSTTGALARVSGNADTVLSTGRVCCKIEKCSCGASCIIYLMEKYVYLAFIYTYFKEVLNIGLFEIIYIFPMQKKQCVKRTFWLLREYILMYSEYIKLVINTTI